MISSENQNFFIATMLKNGNSAADAHRYLKNAYGEDHVVNERRVRKIAQEFKAGRTVFITVSNNYNVDIVREVIEEDSCVFGHNWESYGP